MRRRLGQMERRDLIAYIRELEEQVMPDHDSSTDRYTDVHHAVLDALFEYAKRTPTELEDAILKALVRFEEYKREKLNEKKSRYLQAQLDYAGKEARIRYSQGGL